MGGSIIAGFDKEFVEHIGKTYPGEKIWAFMRENLSRGFANIKGADQPAHSHSLISSFVIRFLESIISKLGTEKNSIF